ARSLRAHRGVRRGPRRERPARHRQELELSGLLRAALGRRGRHRGWNPERRLGRDRRVGRRSGARARPNENPPSRRLWKGLRARRARRRALPRRDRHRTIAGFWCNLEGMRILGIAGVASIIACSSGSSSDFMSVAPTLIVTQGVIDTVKTFTLTAFD